MQMFPQHTKNEVLILNVDILHKVLKIVDEREAEFPQILLIRFSLPTFWHR